MMWEKTESSDTEKKSYKKRSDQGEEAVKRVSEPTATDIIHVIFFDLSRRLKGI